MKPRINALTFIHGILVVMMLGIAGQLYTPPDTFASGPAWNVIARIFTEQQAGSICWACGCFGLVGMFNVRPWLRLTSVLVLSIAHGAIAIGFFLAVPTGIAFLLLFGFASQGLFLVYRRVGEE